MGATMASGAKRQFKPASPYKLAAIRSTVHTSRMTSGFIDLNREFIRHDEKADPEQSALLSYFGAASGQINWNSLIEHGRVVVLGEAGSGKTWEFKAQQKKLSADGAFAFFLPIEELVARIIPDILGPDDEVKRYWQWHKGDDPAVFFLDAVDEARLANHHAFSQALKGFSRNLGAHVKRARVLLSCRVSEWQAVSDPEIIRELLPPLAIESTKQESDSSQEEGNKRARVVAVFQLAPLDEKRIRIMAKARLENADDFLDAIHEKDAWDFARRPIDVENLIRYWNQNRRLGSRTEILEYDIDCKLKEINNFRIGHDHLDHARARKGIERLAAAVTFCRQFTFPIPGEPASRDGQATGLDPSVILPDWPEREVRTLLGRAIFDEASFGKIRFHHRNTIDYLAACWLKNLMEANCPTSRIERLLFRPSYEDRDVVAPSLAPVAGWLAGWNRKIHARIMEVEADILLRHGDPQSLRLEDRTTLLRRIAEQGSSQEESEDLSQLRRLSDDALAPTIIELLKSHAVSTDSKRMLLLLVREGRLRACADIVLAIVRDGEQSREGEQSNDLSWTALTALGVIGNHRQLLELASAAIAGTKISVGLASLLINNLYPKHVDEAMLGHLLRKTENAEFRSIFGLPQTLEKLAIAGIDIPRLPAFIRLLLALLQGSPFNSEERGAPEIFQPLGWLGETLKHALVRLLKAGDLAGLQPDEVGPAIDELELFHSFQGRDRDPDFVLQEPLSPHQSLRRTLFWRLRSEQGSEGRDCEIRQYRLSAFDAPWVLSKRDIDWLLADAREKKANADERRLAFRLAIVLWRLKGRWPHQGLSIMACAISSPILWRTYWSEMTNPILQFMGRLRKKIFNRGEIQRVLKGQLNWMRIVGSVVLNWRKLVDGNAWGLYRYFICNERRPPYQYESIHRQYGPFVAWLVRKGLKNYWRRWQPPVRFEEPNRIFDETHVALLGIELDVEDGLDFSALSNKLAITAARHAPYQLDGFPRWMPRLLVAHPNAVRSVLKEELRGEFALSEDKQIHGTIRTLVYDEGPLRDFIAPEIAALLRAAEPPNFEVAHDAVKCLMKAGDRATLAVLAPARTLAAVSNQNRFLLWLSTWLQVEALTCLDFLECHLAERAADADHLMVGLANALFEPDSDFVSLDDPDFHRTEALAQFVPLFFQHIRTEEDNAPFSYRNAEQFAEILLGVLADIPGRETYDLLTAWAEQPAFARGRDWLLHLAMNRAKSDADHPAWSAEDVVAFAERFERPPRSSDELFDIALWRLDDIKRDAEDGDFSERGRFGVGDDEEVVQVWLAGKLRDRSQRMYYVVREGEVARHKKPDIRLVAATLDPVTIEIKWAHKNSYNDLRRSALETQLVGQYMRANNSHHGILVLVNLESPRNWRPDGEEAFGFLDLCSRLSSEAEALAARRDRAERLSVVGIDLS
ncbi:MAG: hypothetical protein HZC25_12815 [Rhodospirillales bacterium]|nr:hypothetical protein [Rhodospirillales bacterium]